MTVHDFTEDESRSCKGWEKWELTQTEAHCNRWRGRKGVHLFLGGVGFEQRGVDDGGDS